MNLQCTHVPNTCLWKVQMEWHSVHVPLEAAFFTHFGHGYTAPCLHTSCYFFGGFRRLSHLRCSQLWQLMHLIQRSPFLHTYDACIGVNAGNSLWLGGCLFRNIKWWDTQSSGGWLGIWCDGDGFFYKNLFTMSEFLFQIEGLSYSESHFFQTCT